MKFKPGNKIICIKESSLLDDMYGVVGQIYTVKKHSDIRLEVVELPCLMYASRFKLVEKDTPKKLTTSDWGF